MRRTAIALFATLFTSLAVPAGSQETATSPDVTSGQSHEKVWFVPRLAGALSLGGALRYSFPLGGHAGFPPNWEVSAGWRHFFDGHGRTSLRFYGTYGRGFFLTLEETPPLAVGGGIALTGRAISQDWVFGAASLKLDAALLRATPVDDPRVDPTQEPTLGYQVGLGAETTFGSLFMLDPYLFADTGASASINRVGLGRIEAWEVWVRWTLRFEWAIPRTAE